MRRLIGVLLAGVLGFTLQAVGVSPAEATTCTNEISRDTGGVGHGTIFKHHFDVYASVGYAQCQDDRFGHWADPRNLTVRYRHTSGPGLGGGLRQVIWTLRIWDSAGHEVNMSGALPRRNEGWEEDAAFIRPGSIVRMRRYDGEVPRWELKLKFDWSQGFDDHKTLSGYLWAFVGPV